LLALPGTSRGASTAVYTSIGVLEKCFAGELTGAAWLRRLKEIIPSFGISLIGDADFARRIRVATTPVLRTEQV
jgi:malate dehydrogenase (quinone)